MDSSDLTSFSLTSGGFIGSAVNEGEALVEGRADKPLCGASTEVPKSGKTMGETVDAWAFGMPISEGRMEKSFHTMKKS